MSTADTIKEMIVKIVHCEREQITPTTTWKDLKADSLDLVQLLIATEDTFNIEISDEAAEGLTNFGDFVAYVDRCLAEKAEVS